MFYSDTFLKEAHRYCTSNEIELKNSDTCGCFYCLSVFSPNEITEWIYDKGGKTAICPHCGIDSVIPSNSGLPLGNDFLEAMHKKWF